MATNTTNYNLKKPAGTDAYDIADANGNMDLIDTQMKANADATSTNTTSIGTLASLATSAKSSLVAAINELNEKNLVLSPVLGLQWNQTTDTYTRLDDAYGLSVTTTSSPHVSDFSDYYPWAGMRRCNLADDKNINAYYGDANYADDGSNGMVMVEIPKFYYRTIYDTTADNVWQWRISPVPRSGYKVHPAFVDGGIEKEFIYVSAYEGYNNGGTLESKSGVQPEDTQTIGTFRTQAQVHGSGWGLMDFTTTNAVQLLYLIEYANMYAQNVLSEGITNLDGGTVNHSQNTGHTSSLGNASGEVTILSASLENGATGSDTHPFSYRGIENFYGNIYKFIDGILLKDDGYYVGGSIDDYSDAGTGYLKVSATPITTDGYATNFENLASMDYAFMPNAVGGSSSTYMTDYFYAHDTGETNIVFFSGSWVGGSSAGAFYWRFSDVASAFSRSFGARLLCK